MKTKILESLEAVTHTRLLNEKIKKRRKIRKKRY